MKKVIQKTSIRLWLFFPLIQICVTLKSKHNDEKFKQSTHPCELKNWIDFVLKLNNRWPSGWKFMINMVLIKFLIKAKHTPEPHLITGLLYPPILCIIESIRFLKLDRFHQEGMDKILIKFYVWIWFWNDQQYCKEDEIKQKQFHHFCLFPVLYSLLLSRRQGKSLETKTLCQSFHHLNATVQQMRSVHAVVVSLTKC